MGPLPLVKCNGQRGFLPTGPLTQLAPHPHLMCGVWMLLCEALELVRLAMDLMLDRWESLETRVQPWRLKSAPPHAHTPIPRT